jgi:hypothetical protein
LNQSQTIDSINLTVSGYVLSVDDLSQGQSIDNVVLVAYLVYALNINNLSQSQSIGNVILTAHMAFDNIITPWRKTFAIVKKYRSFKINKIIR